MKSSKGGSFRVRMRGLSQAVQKPLPGELGGPLPLPPGFPASAPPYGESAALVNSGWFSLLPAHVWKSLWL